MEPTAISIDMLKTAEGQSNAVFACVGSALQHAQRYEQALKFFIRTIGRMQPGGATEESVEALANHLEKQTLGRLLKRFNSKVKVSDPGIPKLLEDAVEKRNFLAHHFFLEREHLIAEEPGRFSLLSELAEMDELFEKAGNLTRAMGIVLEEVIEGTRKETKGPVVFTMEIKEA